MSLQKDILKYTVKYVKINFFIYKIYFLLITSLIMNLFINAVSQYGILILFDEKRNIIAQHNITILGNESSLLIGHIDDFLKKNNCDYQQLQNFVVVNWPGSFTWIRTIVLAVNTMNYICHKYITPISFFDLFEKYPIIKNSSKRDIFVKYKKTSIISIVKNDDFIEYMKREKIDTIYWDLWNNMLKSNIQEVIWDINYSKILQNITFEKNKIIEPLYIKKPSIS